MQSNDEDVSGDATLIHQPDDATRIMGEEDDATLVNSDKTLLADEATLVTDATPADQPQREGFTAGSMIRDRFRLEEQIGEGGMGVVYTARDMRKEEAGDQDSLIAIKLLSDTFSQHPDALRLLQQETRKTQKLAHPNVVTVYDFDRDGITVYMTMEYLSGITLTDHIRAFHGEGQDLQVVLPIISDIVHGLQYAHEQEIIHSDLKPGNVFLTEGGVTKILDFGIARAAMGDSKLIALTPKYASPEMFDDAPPDPRDDIFALACIAYELLAGKHPYDGRPAKEAKQGGYIPSRISRLSERQWKGLLQGLALEREQRSPSAEAFLQAFLPKRKQPWRWATLGVGVIALTFSAYLMLRPPQEVPLSDVDQQRVDQQIAVAREHMEVGSLGNALENYKMILALAPYDKTPPGGDFIQHPYNRMATEGLEELLYILETEASAAIENGALEDAQAFVQAGLDVDKNHAGLKALAIKISGAMNK